MRKTSSGTIEAEKAFAADVYRDRALSIAKPKRFWHPDRARSLSVWETTNSLLRGGRQRLEA